MHPRGIAGFRQRNTAGGAQSREHNSGGTLARDLPEPSRIHPGRDGPGDRNQIREELPLSTRVHELAKELGLKSPELLERIQNWGLDVKASNLASLDPATVDRIRELSAQSASGQAPASAPPSRGSAGRRIAAGSLASAARSSRARWTRRPQSRRSTAPVSPARPRSEPAAPVRRQLAGAGSGQQPGGGCRCRVDPGTRPRRAGVGPRRGASRARRRRRGAAGVQGRRPRCLATAASRARGQAAARFRRTHRIAEPGARPGSSGPSPGRPAGAATRSAELVRRIDHGRRARRLPAA